MAESEASDRRANERASLTHTIIISYLGITFVFLSVLIIALLVWYALSREFDAVAGAIAVGCMAAVAAVFVFFNRNRKREAHDN